MRLRLTVECEVPDERVIVELPNHLNYQSPTVVSIQAGPGGEAFEARGTFAGAVQVFGGER